MICYIMIIHTIWKRDTLGLVLAKSLAAGKCHGNLKKFYFCPNTQPIIDSVKTIQTRQMSFLVGFCYHGS